MSSGACLQQRCGSLVEQFKDAYHTNFFMFNDSTWESSLVIEASECLKASVSCLASHSRVGSCPGKRW